MYKVVQEDNFANFQLALNEAEDNGFHIMSGHRVHVMKNNEYYSAVMYKAPLHFPSLEMDRLTWSLEMFPEATVQSSLIKCKHEIAEIEEDIKNGVRNPVEYVDALMALLDSAGRQGIYVNEIIQAFNEKLKINKGRDWIKNDDNTYSHVKK